MSAIREIAACSFLASLGLCGVVADLFGLRGLQDLSAAAGASPTPGAPLRDPSPFSLPGTRLFLFFADGSVVELDARRLRELSGPPRRRATYRLALARGPQWSEDDRYAGLFASLISHALAPGSDFRSELGLDPAVPITHLQYQPAGALGVTEAIVIEVSSP
jgi:hypothetical protein